MAQPTRSDVHIDVPLTNVSVAYIQDALMFIWNKVFPVVPVDKISGKYYKYTKDDWFRDDAKPRADAAESAGSGFGLTTGSYSADPPVAFHKDVADKIRANADPAINLEVDAAKFVTQILLLNREVQWMADYFAIDVWGTDATPSPTWDDVTSAPVSDVEVAKRTILQNTGFEANTLVLGYQVWEKLKNHPSVVDRYKYTTAESVTPEMIARLFEVDKVLIAKSVKNTAAEGAASPVMAFTAGKNALLCHSAPNPGLLTPSAGYTFAWRGISGGLGTEIVISNIRIEIRKADRIEGEIAVDFGVVAKDMGYFLSGAVA